jgi:hypothetical protein
VIRIGAIGFAFLSCVKFELNSLHIPPGGEAQETHTGLST